jgi:recyclin-1
VPTPTHEQARFLGSHNPAQVKRNVLASFTDVLLLPVTIVPRTTMAVGKAFGAALTTGGTAAAQGISMLNPQRWGASALQRGGQTDVQSGYIDFEKGQDAAMVFDIGEDEDEDEGKRGEKVSFEVEETHQMSRTRGELPISLPQVFSGF